MPDKRETVQRLKRTLADLTPEELVFFDEFIDAVVAGDEEKQYQMWRDVLTKLDEIPDEMKDNPFVKRYLDEKKGANDKMNNIITIQDIPCYEENGVAYLNLEVCARGLGFTTVAASGNEVVRWNTVFGYLESLSVATSCNGMSYQEMCPVFIPENVFYRLAMKAKNEVAEAFQAKIADEVIPAIRKKGGYIAKPLSPAELSLLQAQALVDLERQQKEQQVAIDTVSTRLDNIGDIIALNPNDWRRESKEMIVRIAQALGGNSFIRDVTAEIYQIMLDRFGISVKTQLTNKRRKALEEGMPKSRADKISGVDVIADDKKLIEAYLTVIKEMAIKYGLDKSA